MRLIKFRILNYKSIKDSGDCWLASDITILAGKNESGKTAILEALRDFDPSVEKPSDAAIPIDDSGKPMIGLTFELSADELNTIVSALECPFSEELTEYLWSDYLVVRKSADGRYFLGKELGDFLKTKAQALNSYSLRVIQGALKELKKYAPSLNFISPNFHDGALELKLALVTAHRQISEGLDALELSEKARQSVTELVTALSDETDKLDSADYADRLRANIASYLPQFVMFSDFADLLPFELPFTEARSFPIVADFARVAGLDLDRVAAASDRQVRRNLLSKCSAAITGDFLSYWDQDQLELVAEPDGEILRFGVRESRGEYLFQPEQRSKGFQWFLSFYLRLNSQDQSTSGRVILIDEPGLHLHAKAQRDVLKVLESLSKKAQVIFSTHSPYLIDPDHLNRVRLVLKDPSTRIDNKIHRTADAETLTPIVTALGHEISSDFSNFGKYNVLVEGISDYYYLQSFRQSFVPRDIDNNFKIIRNYSACF